MYFKAVLTLLQNEDDVKVVVANNFNDIVLDESKDVLLEVLNKLKNLHYKRFNSSLTEKIVMYIT